jgi:toxin ParE1/3/4
MKVVFTDEAETNLEIIGDYIALDNPVRAASFVDEIRDRVKDVAIFPEAYPVVGRYRAYEVRRVVFGSYLIFYRISAGSIEVLKIIHGATDFDIVNL